MSVKQIEAGGAFVRLYTKDGALDKGLTRAQNKLRMFSKFATGIGTKVAGIGAVVGGSFFAMAKTFAAAGDEVHKMNLRTGIATESLSQLAFATSQSGSSLQDFEKGVKSMQKLLLDVDQGSKAAADTLARLGLTVDDLAGKTPEEQFLLMAERISQIEDPGTRAALSMEAFGRAGQTLLPMLSLGAEGIRKLMNEADSLGLTLDQEAADSAAEMTDALDRMTRSAKAMGLQIGGAVAPSITEMLERLKPTIASIQQWISENKETVQTLAKVSTGVVVVGGGLVALGLASKAAATAIGALRTALTVLSANPAFLLLSGLAASLTLIAVAANDVQSSTSKMNQELKKTLEIERELSDLRATATDKVIQRSRQLPADEAKSLLSDTNAIHGRDQAAQQARLKKQTDKRDRDFANYEKKYGAGARMPESIQNIYNNAIQETQSQLNSTNSSIRKINDEINLITKGRRGGVPEEVEADSNNAEDSKPEKSGFSLTTPAIFGDLKTAFAPALSGLAQQAQEIKDQNTRDKTGKAGYEALKFLSPGFSAAAGAVEGAVSILGKIPAGQALREAPEVVSRTFGRLSQNQALEAGTGEAQRIIAEALAPRVSVEEKSLKVQENIEEVSRDNGTLLSQMLEFFEANNMQLVSKGA